VISSLSLHDALPIWLAVRGRAGRVHPVARALTPIELVVVGAGNRGYHAYGAYARNHPGEVQVVAVAEPDAERRDRFAEAHGIPRSEEHTSELQSRVA